jgi:azurin
MATRKESPTAKLQDTVIEILNNFGKVSEDSISKVTVEKFDKILSLISCNIKLSSDNRNFDTNEFRVDKSSVFNYKMKYTSTGQISKEDMIELNLFFQKHKNIAKILLDR